MMNERPPHGATAEPWTPASATSLHRLRPFGAGLGGLGRSCVLTQGPVAHHCHFKASLDGKACDPNHSNHCPPPIPRNITDADDIPTYASIPRNTSTHTHSMQQQRRVCNQRHCRLKGGSVQQCDASGKTNTEVTNSECTVSAQFAHWFNDSSTGQCDCFVSRHQLKGAQHSTRGQTRAVLPPACGSPINIPSTV